MLSSRTSRSARSVPKSVSSRTGAPSPDWLLDTWNVARATEELNRYFYLI